MVHSLELSPTALFRLRDPNLPEIIRWQCLEALWRMAALTPAQLQQYPSHLEAYGDVFHRNPEHKVFISGDAVVIFRCHASRVVVEVVCEEM